MTTTDLEDPADLKDDADDELRQLLVRSARGPRERAVAQALADEGALLRVPTIRRALAAGDDGLCDFERLRGLQYGSNLDGGQRAFFGLLMSLLGIGVEPLAAAHRLDERRLAILLRAIARVAENHTIAIGTRM
jgi:hypothetical protein